MTTINIDKYEYKQHGKRTIIKNIKIIAAVRNDLDMA